jgi:hypothetical protein
VSRAQARVNEPSCSCAIRTFSRSALGPLCDLCCAVLGTYMMAMSCCCCCGGKSIVDAVEIGSLKPSFPGDASWTTSSWIDSLNIVNAAVAAAMLGDGIGHEDELVTIRRLAGTGNRNSLLKRLKKHRVLETLADGLWPALVALSQQEAATGEMLQSKFVQEGNSFQLSYGGLDEFFGGLEGKVGSPDPRVRHAMKQEHSVRADSFELFTTSNYSMETCAETEWRFVAEPESSNNWPSEGRPALVSGQPCVRSALPLSALEGAMHTKNCSLRASSQTEMILEEAIAGRLYTGPMFMKYNAILRGITSQVPPLVKAFESLCKGNTYTTTLHVINSAVVKLSKLTVATTVYRGIAGGMLPQSFWESNQFGVKGGIEPGFMSTTTDRAVAVAYAGSAGPGKARVCLELRQGMVERGAELDWLSQYPHEREILFAPLAGLEVQDTRVEDDILVVQVRASVNLVSATIEQVVGRRFKLVQECARRPTPLPGTQL